MPQTAQLLPGADDATITAAAPRFEDSFVALLLERLPVLPPAAANAPARAAAAGGDVDCGAASDAPFWRVPGSGRYWLHRCTQGKYSVCSAPMAPGKSTNFRMLCGLLPPSEGILRVAGFDLRTAAARARGRIGYMAQKFSLYGDLNSQNLRFFSSAYKLHGARQRARIDWALTAIRPRRLRERGKPRFAVWLQTAAGARLRLDARARNFVSRRANLRRRSAGKARVLAAHQRVGEFRHHRHRDHPFHGGSGVLRSPCDHGAMTHSRRRHGGGYNTNRPKT